MPEGGFENEMGKVRGESLVNGKGCVGSKDETLTRRKRSDMNPNVVPTRYRGCRMQKKAEADEKGERGVRRSGNLEKG